MDPFLAHTPIIDWQHPEVLALAQDLGRGTSPREVAARCFEWVRDEIRHSVDYRDTEVSCSASEVLKLKTGFCYAKSHLLAALLRANGIPAGFGYQRLSISGAGPPFCLHGFNAALLPETGWYRMDARGNFGEIHTEFIPPQECLAFMPQLPGEETFPDILPEPLPFVVAALQRCGTVAEVMASLPDGMPDWRSPGKWKGGP